MTFAKLTPPSTAGLLPRERLFARLDQVVDRRLAWIAAPAGAGKTSLAASWIAARGPRPLWYRMDADDADPAGFFHYLALAAGDGGTGLPALTPEYMPGLATFSRRFFRTLFESVPAPCVLVFDNYQEVPVQTPLHALLAIAAEELPPGAALLVMSRFDPPPALARTFLPGMALGWGELRFTEAETVSLLEDLDAGEARKVHAATRGWAAGIVLTARSGVDRVDPIEAGQAAFDYIAAEFFDTLPGEQRDFLLRMGIFPVVTEGFCIAMTGSGQGMAWLAELHREHLFVTPQAHGERAYEWHPLLRAFLRQRMAERFDADERATILRRGAAALEQAGLIEGAAEAWALAGDWLELGRLICVQGPGVLASGRHAMLLGWLERLPAAAREASPWLVFWAAACRMMTDPAVARSDFERAYADFGAAGDTTGQWLCWGGIAETFLLGWDSLAGFDPWIAELEMLLARQRAFPSAEAEARVLSGAVALVFRRPDHPLLPIWAERALALIRGRQVLAHTAMLAHFAGAYHMWRGHTHGMEAVLETVRVVDAPMPPLGRLLMGMLDLVCANFQGDTARVEAAFADAMAIAREHGVHLLDVPLIQNAGFAALARGDAERMEALNRQGRPALLPGRWMEASAQVYLEAGLSLLRGELAAARCQTDRALPLAVMGGIPHWETHARLFTAHLDMLDGKAAACADALESIVAEARRTGCDLYLAAGLLSMARAWLEAGEKVDEAAVTGALREALALGARWNYGHLFLYAAPQAESRLCARVLEADIEPRYVRGLIKRRGLSPPEGAGEHWPWPVRVYTLGGFRLVCGDEEMRPAGKPQRRPLDLLKALVAQGPAGSPAHNLAALLWPDTDGDGLKKTLEITLHRLRKLLGQDSAVLLREGRLALNPRVCWVDLWSFEQACQAVSAQLRVAAADASLVERESERALSLFGGPFLAAEEESAWLLPARDHAMDQFQRLVAALGRHREQGACWDLAADLYRHGLEQDNLNEFLYRRLIFCLQKQGRHAEALGVYRRCRELLSIVLGIAPSAETDTLIRNSRES